MKLVVVAHFEANRTYIAQNLCENKSKPALNCRGKCYLKKQLEKDIKNELANNVSKIKGEVLFVEKLFEPVFVWITTMSKPSYIFKSIIVMKFYLFIFQPPEGSF
jgi:hypothetical protein